MATVIADVRAVKMSGFKRRSLGMFEARFTDASRAILVGKWFHGGYLANVLAEGMKVALFGKVEFDSYAGRTHDAASGVRNPLRRRGRRRGDAARGARRADLRRRRASSPPRFCARWYTAFCRPIDPVDDALPQFLRDRLKMPDRWTALRDIHFPPPESDLRLLNAFRSPAQFRLIFEEFFWLECGVALKRSKARAVPGIAFELNDRVRERVKAMLPFKPTGAQKRVLKEIAEDMAAPHPMNRLLQGDVGSGKTIVAAEAAVIAIENGYQVAVLAPTEILATQHSFTFKQILGKLGYVTALLTGSFTGAGKSAAQETAGGGPGARGDRHARADPERRGVQESGPGDHRRAASFRRAAAAGAGAEGRDAGRAGDDRDADPAHAGDDDVRRPGRQRDRRDAAGAQADRHQAFHRGPHRDRSTAS